MTRRLYTLVFFKTLPPSAGLRLERENGKDLACWNDGPWLARRAISPQLAEKLTILIEDRRNSNNEAQGKTETTQALGTSGS
jgi:hypothetical protein